MKLLELAQGKLSFKEAKKIYSYYTSQIPKTISVSGGNCGQYALALSKFLLDQHGIKTTVWFIGRNPTTEDGYDEETFRPCTDISLMEHEYHEVYHVFLGYNDYPIGITTEELREMAITEYNDSLPCWQDSEANDERLVGVIDNSTEWDTHQSEFLKILNSIQKYHK